jgi:hypothetical protein
MNNDDYKERQDLRNYYFNKNLKSRDIKCKNVEEYAKKQNTFYDPETNQILYGIDSNMSAAGVSNGTCNQVNPLIYTNHYKCGAGAAGGNPCVKDNYNYRFEKPHGNGFKYVDPDVNENFESNCSTCGCSSWYNTIKTTEIIIFLLLIMLLIYGNSDNSNNKE